MNVAGYFGIKAPQEGRTTRFIAWSRPLTTTSPRGRTAVRPLGLVVVRGLDQAMNLVVRPSWGALIPK